ncbi:F390 synthetase-related protein [Paenibacillus mendelii]|uniref:F390 synthetase-related protein n=1 Tax=Paenibacillus mendelii TaxID=206163 RepID=A0ABV6JG21_9BACL|nr:F390 synthetase-related protein [Paenibacillus mendelii]MCQ6557725.1 adenylate cyclase [Paenibacillus mendelii]
MSRLNRIITFLRHYSAARYFRRWTDREAFERWQERRIVRHLDIVRKDSSFYRNHWKDLPTSRWREFPLIDKKTMMAHFDQLNTVGVRKEEAFAIALKAETTRDFAPTLSGITIGLSSGTSGNRGLFLVSPQEQHAWAGTMLAKLLPGSLMQRERVAFFLRADSNLYQSVQGRRLQFAFFDLLDPLEQHLSRLQRYGPTLLVAPPSMLRMLADNIAAGMLCLPDMPRKVISVAEVLDPLDRQHIEAAFGQPVHQVYQCTEGFLASTCRYGTLHLNEDLVAIQKEYVDVKAGKFVPIVTDFSRSAQPIVRYRLDDLLTEAPACRCGSVFTAIQSIEGRCDDCFYLQDSLDPERFVPVFPDFIARTIIAASTEVTAYKAVQHASSRIEVRLSVADAAWPQAVQAVHAALVSLFERIGCRLPEIQFPPCEAEEATASYRKLRRVERRFTIHDTIISSNRDSASAGFSEEIPSSFPHTTL